MRGNQGISPIIPHLDAPNLDAANQSSHLSKVYNTLENDGILKITLGFHDDDSKYLQRLILNLHTHHGHGLPITHSASRGWFWDIRPSPATFQSPQYQARSETMREFPWHTDCSYESSPPRFFALQVLRPDQRGGGTLSVLKVDKLLSLLSSSTKAALSRLEYRITVPPEFRKRDDKPYITGNLLETTPTGTFPGLRFREDIFTSLSTRAGVALEELKAVLLGPEADAETLHLTPECLPRGSIVLMDNRRWLHARNQVKDPNRHLRRVRWDARPFMARDHAV